MKSETPDQHHILIHSLTESLSPETAHREDLKVIEERSSGSPDPLSNFSVARPPPPLQRTEIVAIYGRGPHLLKPQFERQRIAVHKDLIPCLKSHSTEQMKQVVLTS